jgi:hypothetical protein
VRQLLSGSLTHTRTKSLSPTCVLHQMLRRALRVFSSYFSVSCYPPKMMSKNLLLCSLRYVALLRLRLRLRLRLILRSASAPLSLISLSRYRYYPPPRAYSKMFVGGLSWDTTDGTLSLAHLIPPPFAMSCPFTDSLNCRRVMPFFSSTPFVCLLLNQTACGTIFRSLAKSTHAPSFGTQTASRAALRSSRSRTPHPSTQS